MGRPPLKDKTTREQTRTPATYKDELQVRLERNGKEWKDDLHYVIVEDHGTSSEISTGMMIAGVDVDAFKSRGYHIVCPGEEIGYRSRQILMAINKAEYEARYAPRGGHDIKEAQIDMIAPMSEIYQKMDDNQDRERRERQAWAQLDKRTVFNEELKREAESAEE